MITPRTLFIIAWIGIQLAVPAAYYLGEDRFDERFAWRMFSPVRLSECRVRFIDRTDGGEAQVRHGADVHEVWGNLFSRARVSVIEGYADRWCARRRDAGASQPALHVDLVCVNPDRLSDPECAGTNGEPAPGACRLRPLPLERNLCAEAP
ncbi:MAG: hypothetical protein ACOYM9_07165 [Bradymonadia bacterium]